ncbi:MAG: ion channel [Clostridium sp.]
MKRSSIFSFISAIVSLGMAVVLIIALLDYNVVSWDTNISYIHTVVIVIFGYEYIYELITSDNRGRYIYTHITELLSIIPLFVFITFTKAIGLGRLLTITQLVDFIIVILIAIYLLRFKDAIRPLWDKNRIYYMLLLTSIVIVIGALFISIVEGISFGDAIWWSFVTFTTVGYGDVTLYTSFGRIVGVVLMILGIGVIGVLTSTIAVMMFFGGKSRKEKTTYRQEIVENAREKLNHFDDLSKKDLEDMFNNLKSLK